MRKRKLISISTVLAASALVFVLTADARRAAPAPPGTLAFVSDRAQNRLGEIYSVRANGRSRKNLSRAPLTADYALTPSRDGRKVAFFSNRDGTWAVWAMRARGGGMTRVGPVHGEPGAPTISWNPSGTGLAFDAGIFEGVRNEVWVGYADGRRPRKLGRGWRPDWSPRGDRIAFENYREEEEDRAVVVTPRGRVLWSRPGYQPLWSPDGRRIAFVTPRGVVALATPDGRVLRRLGRNVEAFGWLHNGNLVIGGRRISVRTPNGRVVFTAPAEAELLMWSQDGRRVAYVVRAGVFVVGPRGKPRRVHRTFADLMHWSPDGKRLAAVVGTTLVQIRTDGTGTRRIATEPAASSIWSAYWDGNSRLIYESHAPRRGDLYLRTPRGVEQRLTRDAARYVTPDWSRDGTRIVASATDVRCSRGDCFTDLAVIDTATGEATQLTKQPQNEDLPFTESPRWSPDGELIAFARTGPPGHSIRIVAADGTGERVLHRPSEQGGGAAWPAWAPDGKRVAFMGDGLTVVDLDGTNARQIAAAAGYGTAWSPDGRWIAWRDAVSINVVAADGGTPSVVLGNGPLKCKIVSPSFGGGLAWSADSTRLVFAGCSRRRTALENLDLWSVRADGTGLTRLTRSLAHEYGPAFR